MRSLSLLGHVALQDSIRFTYSGKCAERAVLQPEFALATHVLVLHLHIVTATHAVL
jgi:hypothetical protein